MISRVIKIATLIILVSLAWSASAQQFSNFRQLTPVGVSQSHRDFLLRQQQLIDDQIQRQQDQIRRQQQQLRRQQQQQSVKSTNRPAPPAQLLTQQGARFPPGPQRPTPQPAQQQFRPQQNFNTRPQQQFQTQGFSQNPQQTFVQRQPQQAFVQFPQQNFQQQQFQNVRPQQQFQQQQTFRPQQQFQQQVLREGKPVSSVAQQAIPVNTKSVPTTPTTTTQKPEKVTIDPDSLNPPTEDNPSPTNNAGRRFVAQPQLTKCQNRIIHDRHGKHGYYFSWLDPKYNTKMYDWLDARNFCRQRCMDSVSIETAEEDAFVQEHFMKGYRNKQVEHVWTSGRVCDFDGCDREDLQPVRVNGWFWPATNNVVKLKNATKAHEYAGWSDVGGFTGVGQPDNRQGNENCIAILDPKIYGEPDNLPHWHDVKCEYRKKMVCEDNDNLLGFIRQENRGAFVPWGAFVP